MEFSKSYNKRLCEKYPFLIPRNSFSGKRITEGAGFWPGSPDEIPQYDYEYTEMDEMPEGWRKAFGANMLNELKLELEKHGKLSTYVICQIKEKYGEMRWYDFGGTKKTREIIEKYTKLSRKTCIVCGKPATRITTGWISPYCDDCCPEKESIPIDEWEKSQEDSPI